MPIFIRISLSCIFSALCKVYRGTAAATSSPPIWTHYKLIMHVKPFQPLMALVGLLYVPRSRCLLLSAVDPIGTGGHEDPNRGTLPGEAGHLFATVDFPTPYFPHCPLYHFIPLSFSYFISLSLCLYSLFLPFPLGCLYLLPPFMGMA